MNTIMTTSTCNPTIGFGRCGAAAGRTVVSTLAQRQRLPRLTVGGPPPARPATPVWSGGRLVLPAPDESAAGRIMVPVLALTAGAALAEAFGLMARLAPQWDAFTALVARLIA